MFSLGQIVNAFPFRLRLLFHGESGAEGSRLEFLASPIVPTCFLTLVRKSFLNILAKDFVSAH